jgi:hypothetical protein
MATATRRKNKNKHNKTSKHTKKALGENKPLERFWSGLASGKYVEVIYKNGKNKRVHLPSPNTKKSQEMFNSFEEDTNVVAVLSSNISRDAYNVYLHPKAKDKSVMYVIKNYKQFFTFMGIPGMNKLMAPG